MKRFPISKLVLAIMVAALGFVLSSPPRSLAQYRFDSYTTDNGLPQNGVRGIVQTPDGYLWFTTFDGLVRFDGIKFTVFDKNNSPGILSNRFVALALLPDGSLVAGTEESGLTVLRNGVFKTYTTTEGLPSNAVSKMVTDAHGELVIGTTAGNCYFRDGKFTAVPADAFPDNGLFYLSPTKHFWRYGASGVHEATPDGRQVDYPITLEYFNDNYAGIRLLEDRDGYLWLGDTTGVYRLKDGAVTKFTGSDGIPPNTFLRPSLQDNDGGIWFLSGYFGYTEKVGLVRFREGKFVNWKQSGGAANPDAGVMFKDREGTLWVGGDAGLSHISRQFIRSYSVTDGLPFPEVYPLLQTRNGDIYAGTVQGLSRFRDGKFTNAGDNEPGRYLSVTSLYEDRNGVLWVGDVISLSRLDTTGLRKLEAIDQTAIWSITGAADGDLWLGTSKGLFRLRNEQVIAHYTQADGLPGDDVKVVRMDRNGALWIGTYGGLAMVDPALVQARDPAPGKLAFRTFRASDGLASDRVRSLYEDADGTMWVGTYDGGLSRFRDGKLFTYTVANGLFNNGVFAILDDGAGNFWISCNRGIYRVARQELNDLAAGKLARLNSIAYGKTDGMLNTECNGGRQPAGIRAADGKFWFPTQGGVAVVDPRTLAVNPAPPPVRIESVLVERAAVDPAQGITLRANRDNLEIRFTGISFIKPEQVKFRYRIEGLSENWTDLGTIREVYFPSLPPGEYTFHVIAANSDGVWNQEGARIKLFVRAPFWRRPWFIAGAVALVLLAGFFIIRSRIKQLQRRQLVQQEFSRKLLGSQESERQRIAVELHDSIGQSLLIIKNRAYIALGDLDERDMVKEQLEELSESATHAIEECREISYNLRPYQIERFGLTKTLEAIFRRISEVSPIATTVSVAPIDGLFTPEAENNLYRVVQESVNNIIKHSGATEARLTIRRTGDRVEIEISDNGRGFDQEQSTREPSKRSGFGLIGIAERIRMMGASFEIDSHPGRGTRLRIGLVIAGK
jgi:signal transduction histidine kinase/ligand-binding sensor domain-containing protein